MLRLRFIGLVAPLLLGAGHAVACAPLTQSVRVNLPEPQISVEAGLDPGRYHWPRPISHTGSGIVNGLTLVGAKGQIEASVTTAAEHSGLCIAHIDFVVGIPFDEPIRILMREQLDPSSCAYAAVYAHEQHHVQISKEARRIAAGQAADEIAAYAHQIALGPMNEVGVSEEISRFNKQINDRMMSFYGRVADHWNAAIDSPKSYRSLQAQCHDWR